MTNLFMCLWYKTIKENRDLKVVVSKESTFIKSLSSCII